MIEKLVCLFSNLDENTKHIARKTSTSLLVKVVGILASFGISVFLGRVLGAEGLGIINLSNQILMVLLVFSLFGMQHVIVKKTAIAYEEKQKSDISNILFTTLLFNGGLATLFIILGCFLAPSFSDKIIKENTFTIPLLIFLFGLLPLTLSRIWSFALNGIHKIWQSNLFVEVLNSLFVGSTLLIFYILGHEINTILVAYCYTISRLLVCILSWVYWKKVFKYRFEGRLVLKPLLKMGMPLLLVSATHIIASNADAIMLGWLGDLEDVGLYSVAARISLLISFILQASNAAISPKLAAMFAKGNIEQMQKMVNEVTFGLFFVAGFFMVFIIFATKHILPLWGEEFIYSYEPLVWLGAGQFFNISTGCSGMLLIMCGYEKLHGWISLFFVCLNLILNFFLINQFGLVGAAMATGITITMENIFKMYFAYRKVGILTIPIKRRKKQ